MWHFTRYFLYIFPPSGGGVAGGAFFPSFAASSFLSLIVLYTLYLLERKVYLETRLRCVKSIITAR